MVLLGSFTYNPTPLLAITLPPPRPSFCHYATHILQPQSSFLFRALSRFIAHFLSILYVYTYTYAYVNLTIDSVCKRRHMIFVFLSLAYFVQHSGLQFHSFSANVIISFYFKVKDIIVHTHHISHCNETINIDYCDLCGFEINLTRVSGNKEMTDTCTEKLGSIGPCNLIDKHQNYRNRACLL